jgi:hypothetical protein
MHRGECAAERARYWASDEAFVWHKGQRVAWMDVDVTVSRDSSDQEGSVFFALSDCRGM